jgi:hypothetical protein
MMYAVLWLLLLLQGPNPSQESAAKGSISGTVQRSDTREPLDEVHVLLLTEELGGTTDFLRPPPIFEVLTEPQGKFVFKDLPAGNYRITFSANGYVRQEYGQRTFPGRGSLIQLAAGEIVKDLVVSLTPTATVSGTIRDADKRPLSGVPVQLMRATYDFEGDRMVRPFGTVAVTDDRGEYRLYYVTPGRYFLNAGTPQGPSGFGDPRLGANHVSELFSYSFFPGVADIRLAGTVDVQAGTDLRGMDFTLSIQQGVRVRGRIIDSTTGKPPEKPTIRLNYRDPGTGWDYDFQRREKVTYESGNFEFRYVLPGMFSLSASVDVPDVAPLASGQRIQRRGYVPIEVGGSDVDGIVVILSPGEAVPGRLRIDGSVSLAEATYPNSNAGMRLIPVMNGGRASIGSPEPTAGRLNPDGTFRFENVSPGEYRLQVAGLRPQFFVKAARFGSTDILDVPFQFTGREPASLEVVVSPNVGSVDGIVTDNRLSAVQGAQVVLIPDQARHRPELFKVARTDQNGRFVIRNVAPASYRLYAWESMEPNGWFDLELARKYEQYSRPVRITESSQQSIDARLIPAN